MNLTLKLRLRLFAREGPPVARRGQLPAAGMHQPLGT
jgi:hypothetical protein